MTFSESHASEILKRSPDAVLVVDAGGRIEFASDRVETLFGYTPDEARSLYVENLLPEENRAAHVQKRAAYFDRPLPRPMGRGLKLHGLRRDGREFPVDVALSSVGEGEALHAVCTVRDVAERVRFEEGLKDILQRVEQLALTRAAEARRSEEHLRLFVRNTPAAVAMLDRDMRYLLVSHRWLEDYGLDERDLTGVSHYEVFPNLPERWKAAHQRCLAGEAQSSDEDCFVRPDGRLEWLRWELIPWRGSDAEIGGVLLMTEVITERKLAETALMRNRAELEQRVEARTAELRTATARAERGDQFKSHFLAAAGHDLRQPLQAALGYLGALRRQITDPDLAATCDKAREPLASMGEILNVLLDAAKLREGGVKPDLVDVAAGDLLARTVASNRGMAEEKGLALVAEPSECILLTDPALLGRALDNLVANAIRYTERGGVTIRAEPHGDFARISVSDTGIGIPAHALHTIFDEYVQLANPARDRRRGLGLGLSIVKYLTSLLGLSMTVRSAEGRGSTFEMEVPLGAPAPQPAPEAAGPSAGSTPQHAWSVLLVEDDEAVRDSTLMLLRLSGLDPVGVEDGEAALALIAQGMQPRVIVSDLRLPGISGLETIRRVRARLKRAVPAVLMTGDTAFGETDLDTAEDCRIVYKPVDPDELCDLIVPLCDDPAARSVSARTQA